MHPSLFPRLITLLICLLLASRTAIGATPPPVDPVDIAVATLQSDAEKLFSPKAETNVSMIRPHPAVASLDPELAPRVLKALAGKLSGEPARDMYVRYHLMYVVNRALPGLAKPLDHALIMQLVRAIPDDIKFTPQPYWIFDPPAIGVKHLNLIESCVVKTGFPPFQRYIYPPDSFQYMDAKQRAAAEARYAEAKKLEGQFKRTANVVGDAYNTRMGFMNWALRQYRGELYYASLVANPSALDDMNDAIFRAASANPNRAMDLASFLNVAYANGVLGSYNKDVLTAAAARLKGAAAAYQRVAPKPAAPARPEDSIPLSGWDEGGGRWRHLGDALFTVITGIENDCVPKPIAPYAYARPLAPPAAAPKTPPAATAPARIKPEEVTADDIDAAIARALPALEKLRPPEADFGWMSYSAIGLRYAPPDFIQPGQTALSTWAMLSSGESYKAPWMERRVNWTLAFDSPNTYDRSMRLLMLMLAPPSERTTIAPWLKRDVRWLLESATDQGGWEVQNLGARSAAPGDNANSQYAMLGLWGASQAGYEIPDATWQRIDKYWRLGQRPPGAPGEGAWAVTPSSSLQKGANLNAFSNQVSAAMTAGGVLSLFITESFLSGDKYADVGKTLSPELLRGVQWLDQNFSLTRLDGDSDFYYYTWTIQNVGQATGYRTFNKIDWFREATATLLNTQGADGLWDGPKGQNVSTSFALLYLVRARGPLAICKLRLAPALAGKPTAAKPISWNNRPNDLYNFTRDISRQVEVPTNWQIADLDQPVYQLMESPILYLATSQPFELSPAHKARLKEYLDAGGTLVCAPEGKTTLPVLVSMKKLAAELCPASEPITRHAADKHPFYNLFATVNANIPLTTYDNSVRPLVVVIERDIGKDLQLYKNAQREAFDLLDNIYLYAAGKNAKRPRISSNYLVQHNLAPRTKLAVARITHAGNFDPEPLAMPQLKALMADGFNVQLDIDQLSPNQLTRAAKVAFLTLSADSDLADQDIADLKKWIDAGGTLWVDAAAGSAQAVDKVIALAPKLGLPDVLQSFDKHPVITGEGLAGGFDNSNPELRRFFNSRKDRPELKGAIAGTHARVLLLNGDLTCGLAGINHWNIAGYTPKSARQIVANSLLCAVKENAPPPTTTTAPATKPATTLPK